MPLAKEEEFTELVPSTMSWPAEGRGRDAEATDALRAHVFETVGPTHWCWVLVTFAWLQKWLVRLGTETVVVGYDPKRLQEASNALSQWFETTAPNNTEQFLSAVFLAARLADNLGESIQTWGFTPKTILVRDGSTASDRFRREGWNVDGDDKRTEQATLPVTRKAPSGGRLYRSSWR
jgi:hypothetical protein